MNKSIHIEISGVAGAGKTTLLHLIGAHLQSLGYRVAGVEEARNDQHASVIESFQAPMPVHTPRHRPVLITTRDLRGKKVPEHFAGDHFLHTATFRRVARSLLPETAQ